MGWNSWNSFGCGIDERLIRDTADHLVSSGMRDAGYRYLVVDDCWFDPRRDADGRLRADPVRFPGGVRALADYVHSRGLEFGLYEVPTDRTCAQRAGTYPGATGSRGHEQQDARTFADWGVDYLKYDNCNNQGIPAQQRYSAMGEALRATGRPIVYSVCEWGENEPWTWAPEVGAHLWRTTDDIKPAWETGNGNDAPMGVADIVDVNRDLADYAGPGDWNDPDMLEVGVRGDADYPGLTGEEAKAHFSLWSMMAAPLIAGNDVRAMPGEVRDVLTNREVIAVNQDPLGEQARVIHVAPTKMILVDNEVALLPLTTTEQTVESAVVIRSSAMLVAVMRIFEDLWRFAAPFTSDQRVITGDEQPSEEERWILSLLASGATDDTIGRLMGFSARTAHRRVRELIARLGVETRFQAGMQAVKLGWL